MIIFPFVLGSVALLTKMFSDKDRAEDSSMTLDELNFEQQFLPQITTYDFIIVGGGSAGCIVASRLSEWFSVLLLESGGTPPPATYNPLFASDVQSHPSINKAFVSTPQRTFNLNDRNGTLTRLTGNMLGGSGSHNGNVYVRGCPRDYNHFAEVTGDESWSYKEMEKHFQRIEDFSGHLINEDKRGNYGVGGPISVVTNESPLLPLWYEAGKELGYGIGDPVVAMGDVFTTTARSRRIGKRSSSYTEYLLPIIRRRRNLRVLLYSEVDEILIDSERRAHGVAYKRHGIPQIAHTRHEVIVSAGAFGSPILLLKSGIGPEADLARAGIEIKQNLPDVGKNFRDHGVVSLTFAMTNDRGNLPRVRDSDAEFVLLNQGTLREKGFFLTLGSGPQAFIVSSAAKTKGEGSWPDTQIVFSYQPVLGESQQTILIQAVFNRMESVGHVALNATAYNTGERADNKLALIDYNLFSTQHDIDVAIEGIQLIFKLVKKTRFFKMLNLTYNTTSPDACKGIPFGTPDYWRCFIRWEASDYFHISGTCKMGNNSDPMAVVDSKLRVRGIRKLRVIDASIMPIPTCANINAPTMAIAEKATQDIIMQYLKLHQG